MDADFAAEDFAVPGGIEAVRGDETPDREARRVSEATDREGKEASMLQEGEGMLEGKEDGFGMNFMDEMDVGVDMEGFMDGPMEGQVPDFKLATAEDIAAAEAVPEEPKAQAPRKRRR